MDTLDAANALDDAARAFIDIAHRIVWATVATVDTGGRPSSRVLHPIWALEDDGLVGWIATSPSSPKAAHLAQTPHVSVTYWDATHDTCTANCTAEWRMSPEDRAGLWERFAGAPAPLGYDPAIIPGWDSPEAPTFGALRLVADRIDVMPGAVLMTGQGTPLRWRRG